MKNPEEKINKLSNLFSILGDFILSFIKDMRNESKELYTLGKQNFLQGNLSKKLATLVILSVIFIPMLITYFGLLGKGLSYYKYLRDYDSIKEELLQSYEYSVKDFFQIYNKKYGVDCYWISVVNVDQNMYEKWGTDRKDKQNCALVNKMQIFPLSIGKLNVDKDKKTANASGKALVLIMDNDRIVSLDYKVFNLWRLLDWEDGYWKINPFSNIENLK